MIPQNRKQRFSIAQIGCRFFLSVDYVWKEGIDREKTQLKQQMEIPQKIFKALIGTCPVDVESVIRESYHMEEVDNG